MNKFIPSRTLIQEMIKSFDQFSKSQSSHSDFQKLIHQTKINKYSLKSYCQQLLNELNLLIRNYLKAIDPQSFDQVKTKLINDKELNRFLVPFDHNVVKTIQDFEIEFNYSDFAPIQVMILIDLIVHFAKHYLKKFVTFDFLTTNHGVQEHPVTFKPVSINYYDREHQKEYHFKLKMTENLLSKYFEMIQEGLSICGK